MKRNIFNILGFCLVLFAGQTAFAQTSLDLSAGGSMIAGYDSTACSGSIAGAIRYNSSSVTAGPTDYTHYWTMDETSGTTVADSGGSSDGTWQGSASIVSTSGMIGNAMYFDGTNTYVSIPDAASLEVQTNMTVSMWIKPDAAGLGSAQNLIWKDHSVSPWYGWEMGIVSSNFPMFDIPDNVPNYTTVGGARLYGGQWYHLVGTMSSGANLLFYLDGVRSESWNDGAVPGSLFTTSDGALGLGGDPSSSSGRYTGAIDDVRIYNRTLSASEVNQLYIEGLNGGASSGTGCVEVCNGSTWSCTKTALTSTTGSSDSGVSPLATYDFEGGSIPSDFTFGGDADWTVQTTYVSAGTYAAASGSIANGQSTSMTLHVNLATSKTLKFWILADSEAGWDTGVFLIDQVPKGLWSDTIASGNTWAQQTYSLSAGEHYLTWTYVKDDAAASGSDAIYIDDITFQ